MGPDKIPLTPKTSKKAPKNKASRPGSSYSMSGTGQKYDAKTGVPLTKKGTPDKRYNPRPSSTSYSMSGTGQKYDAKTGVPLTKKGTPDKRYNPRPSSTSYSM